MTTPSTDLVAADERVALTTSVERALPDFLADLERLVNIDCGSYTPLGVNEVATWVAADLESMGASVERRSDPRPLDGGMPHARVDNRIPFTPAE